MATNNNEAAASGPRVCEYCNGKGTVQSNLMEVRCPACNRPHVPLVPTPPAEGMESRSECSVFMEPSGNLSTVRRMVESVMQELGLDWVNDFRLRDKLIVAAAKHLRHHEEWAASLKSALRSLGMPDDADAVEWVRSKIDDLQDRIDAIKGELSNEQPRQAEEFAKRIKAGDDPLAVVREAMSEYKAFYNLSCEFREEDCRKRYNAEQSLQAAEARAGEAERELARNNEGWKLTYDDLKTEADASNAMLHDRINESMKWRGLWSAYRQTEPQEQTRGVIFGELDRHWREVTDDPIAVQAKAAVEQLRELERQQLAAAQARIAELERMRIIDNNAKCTCWSKAPTVPTFRDQNKHLNDCPMRDSGLPVGVNADMGGGASLVCIPRDEYDALQAERAALAERIVWFARDVVKADLESLPIGFKQTIVVARDGKHEVHSLMEVLTQADEIIREFGHAAAALVEQAGENSNVKGAK